MKYFNMFRFSPIFYKLVFKFIPAFLGTFIIVVSIILLENKLSSAKVCRSTETWLACQVRESVFLQVVESVSILSALMLYILDKPERNKKAIYEAWQTFDAAHNQETSYARITALEELNKEFVPLKGIKLRGKYLNYINLEKADLEGVDFERTSLEGAHLQRAKFWYANLNNANFSKANLTNTSFVAAKLKKVNFQQSILIKADFGQCDLSEANLNGADLSKAILKGAILKKTNFKNVKNLTLEQLKGTISFDEAVYDEEFREKLHLLT